MILKMFLRGFQLKSKAVSTLQNTQNLVFCREYAERIVSRKVFNPSFEAEPAAVKEELIEKKLKSYADRMEEKKTQEKKVRKLNKLDKIILVRLGKFKSVDEVPDQLVFGSTKEKVAALQEMKVGTLSQAFQIGFGLEYLLTFFTMGFFAFIYYHYRKNADNLGKKPEE